MNSYDWGAFVVPMYVPGLFRLEAFRFLRFEFKKPSKRVGDVLTCISFCVASKWHVEVVKTIEQSIRSKHLGIF